MNQTAVPGSAEELSLSMQRALCDFLLLSTTAQPNGYYDHFCNLQSLLLEETLPVHTPQKHGPMVS